MSEPFEDLARRIVEQGRASRNDLLARTQKLTEAIKAPDGFGPVLNEYIDEITADGSGDEDGEVLGQEGIGGT